MRRTARWLAPLVAAPWIAWAVGRTLGLDRVHPLIAIVAFTPYAALTAPIPVLVALALRRWAVAAVAAAALVLLALAVVPRSTGDPAPPGRGPELTVMSANLYVGRADAEAVLRLVRRYDVDVLVLVELRPDALRRLDAAGLRRLLPGRVLGAEGSAVFARGALRDAAVPGDPPGAPVADADLDRGGVPPLRVQAAHPSPPISAGSARGWRGLLGDLRAPARGRPSVLAGDFNATLDHRDLRLLLDRGWADAAAEVGEGLRATWPVGRRVLGLAIDHVLAGPGVRVRSFHVHEVRGSDHRAVVARLALPGR